MCKLNVEYCRYCIGEKKGRLYSFFVFEYLIAVSCGEADCSRFLIVAYYPRKDSGWNFCSIMEVDRVEREGFGLIRRQW